MRFMCEVGHLRKIISDFLQDYIFVINMALIRSASSMINNLDFFYLKSLFYARVDMSLSKNANRRSLDMYSGPSQVHFIKQDGILNL